MVDLVLAALVSLFTFYFWAATNLQNCAIFPVRHCEAASFFACSILRELYLDFLKKRELERYM